MTTLRTRPNSGTVRHINLMVKRQNFINSEMAIEKEDNENSRASPMSHIDKREHLPRSDDTQIDSDWYF